MNIPHAAIAGRLGELESYKGRPVAIVCKMGQHAGSAGTVLRKSGFDPVMRLTGGMTEWRNQNLPVVKGKGEKKARKGKGKGKSKNQNQQDNGEG